MSWVFGVLWVFFFLAYLGRGQQLRELRELHANVRAQCMLLEQENQSYRDIKTVIKGSNKRWDEGNGRGA